LSRAGAAASGRSALAFALAVALAECCFTGPAPIGVRVDLADAIRPDALLFGESTGRVLVSTSDAEALLAPILATAGLIGAAVIVYVIQAKVRGSRSGTEPAA